MKEGSPNGHERSPERSWMPEGVDQALGVQGLPTADAFYGEGTGYWVGPEQRAFLAFYPDQKRAELQTSHWVISPKTGAELRTMDDHVMIDSETETEHSTLIVGRDGSVTFISTPLIPPMDDQSVEVAAMLEPDGRLNGGSGERLDLDVGPERSGPRDIAPSAEPLDQPLTSDAVSESRNGKERQDRVKITGRLAYPPQVGQTRSGIPRVQFAVAEHPNPDDRDETVYHDAYATKEFAERIAAQDLQEGEEVRLTGQRQERERDGKTEVKIYAYGVKRTKPQTE